MAARKRHLAFRYTSVLILTALSAFSGGDTVAADYFNKITQKALDDTNPVGAWAWGTGSGVFVAVLDTGVTPSHPDLPTSLLANGYDFINATEFNFDPSYIAEDKNGHGTHVAGIIAGSGNATSGVRGIAPGAKIVPVRIAFQATTLALFPTYCYEGMGSSSLPCTTHPIVRAIDKLSQDACLKRRRTVINISYGGTAKLNYCSEIDKLFATPVSGCMINDWVIVVAAAMNENSNMPSYPASCSHVTAVGAVNGSKRWTTQDPKIGSNFGPWVTIAAPGADVYSAWIDKIGYRKESGTSMAAPFVSGALAVLLSIDPNLPPQKALDYLISTATRVPEAGFGGGTINLSAAVDKMTSERRLSRPAPVPPSLSVEIQN